MCSVGVGEKRKANKERSDDGIKKGGKRFALEKLPSLSLVPVFQVSMNEDLAKKVRFLFCVVLMMLTIKKPLPAFGWRNNLLKQSIHSLLSHNSLFAHRLSTARFAQLPLCRFGGGETNKPTDCGDFI